MYLTPAVLTTIHPSRVSPWQAMMHAASRGYGHIVRHLVEAGADGAIYNLSGQTAADLALANGFHAVSTERDGASGWQRIHGKG